jgi:hypothetical protein
VNILSIYQITHSGSGKKVEFTPELNYYFVLSDGSKIVVGEVNHHSRLYTFSHFTHKYDYVSLLTHANEESRLWHERFGNLNFKYLYHLSKGGMVDGLPHIQYIDGVFHGCILGKHLEDKFNIGKAWRESSLLELVHSDITGPFPHQSICKDKYVLTFIDDFSRYTWVYFLKLKSKVFECLKYFKHLVEKKIGKRIKKLHIDNGGEYVNKGVEHICLESGIELQHTISYSPQHNGVVNRKNKTLKEMENCMLQSRALM